MLVHGNNLTAKENHKKKYQDEQSKIYLAEIREKYDQWHKQNLELIGPVIETKAEDKQIVEERVKLFEDYKTFLDRQHYAEHFDSRSMAFLLTVRYISFWMDSRMHGNDSFLCCNS